MRNLNILDMYRDTGPKVIELYGGIGNDMEGVFAIPMPATMTNLRIIASAGEGWDHVSVSLDKRCPTWEEMSYVRKLFFKDDECVMQLHLPLKDHINCHPFCLHLWRPWHAVIPTPPKEFVGPT